MTLCLSSSMRWSSVRFPQRPRAASVWLLCNVRGNWKLCPGLMTAAGFLSPSGPVLFSWALFRLLPECSSESLGPGSTSWTWTGTRHLCSTMWMALCPSTLAPTSLRMTTGWFGTQTASTSLTGEGPSAAGAMHRWGCHPKPLARPLTPVTRTQIAWRVSTSVLGQERGRIFLPCLSCPSSRSTGFSRSKHCAGIMSGCSTY